MGLRNSLIFKHSAIKAKGENIIRHRLSQITTVPFYNLSKFVIGAPAPGSGLNGLLDDPNQLAPNLNSYINGFSPNVRAIMERFAFDVQIAKMAEKDLLFLVVKKFAAINLSPERVDPTQMGYVFEELTNRLLTPMLLTGALKMTIPDQPNHPQQRYRSVNRHFYRYEPPRPLEVIETDIKRLEGEILAMLKEVSA
jgi:hypothetical protein